MTTPAELIAALERAQPSPLGVGRLIAEETRRQCIACLQELSNALKHGDEREQRLRARLDYVASSVHQIQTVLSGAHDDALKEPS